MNATIDIDVYADFSFNGVEVTVERGVFIGDHDSPCVEQSATFDSMMDNMIEFMSIPGGTVTEKHRDEILSAIIYMGKVIKQKKKYVKKVKEWKSA